MRGHSLRCAVRFLWRLSCCCSCCCCGCGDLNRASFLIGAFSFGFAILTATEQTAMTQCLGTSFVLLALRWRHTIRTTTEFSIFTCFANLASFVEWSSGGRFIVCATTEFTPETCRRLRATLAFEWLLLFCDDRFKSVWRCT